MHPSPRTVESTKTMGPHIGPNGARLAATLRVGLENKYGLAAYLLLGLVKCFFGRGF